MKTFGKFTKIAVAAAVTGAFVLPASAAFAGDKTERAVIGALIGGLAGGALSKGGTNGIVIGAVAGAALGAATDNDHNDRRYSSNHRDTRYGNGYGSSYNSGYGQSYSNGYGRDQRGDRYNTSYRYDGGSHGGGRHDSYYGQRR